MSKNKGKQFNIEKRAILSRMVAKSNNCKQSLNIFCNQLGKF